jgi:D-sedoheptulose 7-phosphate isomerase
MINETATAYLQTLSELMRSVQVTDRNGVALALDDGAKEAVALILSVKSISGKAMLIGNGGSAAVASHIQNDLCKAVGVRTLVFNEQPLLTALGNDHGYGCIFERPIELWASANDLLFAISSSGQSENILRGVQAAVEGKCKVVTLSGFKPDNPLRIQGDLNFYVPSQSYGHVETAHSTLLHFMTDSAAAIRP